MCALTIVNKTRIFDRSPQSSAVHCKEDFSDHMTTAGRCGDRERVCVLMRGQQGNRRTTHQLTGRAARRKFMQV
jgi:hypothetical protein